jgi:hypothetical protein
MVSPFWISVLNFVYSPLTPFPDVKINPEPVLGSNVVILSFTLNRYWKIDSIYGYYYFLLVKGLAYLPSLNFSFPRFIFVGLL